MRKYFFLGLWMSVAVVAVEAESRLEFSTQAASVYESALSLRLDEARLQLQAMRNSEGDNAMQHLLANYIDILHIYATDDPALYERLKQQKDARIKAIKRADKSSPYYRYAQAEIRLQWALVHLKFDNWWTALNDAGKAFELLEDNQKLHPDFIANRKSLGLLRTIAGVVPDNYKWSVKVLKGIKGTTEEGARDIQAVLDYARTGDFIFEEETRMMYALLLLQIGGDYDRAWRLLEGGSTDYSRNAFGCMVKSEIAIRSGRAEAAVQLLAHRPSGTAYPAFPYLDYLEGTALLYSGKSAGVQSAFERFLSSYKGKYYRKDAYRKLAWHALLEGHTSRAEQYYEQCLEYGSNDHETDAQAQREAAASYRPHIGLLRARLLFDGGFYKKADAELAGIDKRTLTQEEYRIELPYRRGRVAEALGMHHNAAKHYRKAIEIGSDAPYYYACKSALQLALLYEDQGKLAKAKSYFNKCLTIKPEEYKSSLHGQAKSGLQRLR